MEADIVAEGGISFEERKYQWKINNFDTIMKRKDLLKLQEFEFECVDSNGVKSCWKLCMRYRKPKSKNIEGKVFWLYFGLMKKAAFGYATRLNAQTSVTVEDSLGKTIFLGSPRKKFRYVAGKPFGLTINKLRHDSNSKVPIVRGALIITFTLRIFTMKTPSFRGDQLSGTEADLCDHRKQEIYRMIGKLENDKENSDVKIVSSDGKAFYAYGWILSKVSEVFKDMLNQSVQSEDEPEFAVVKVNDVSGTTIKILLHFIYTGKLDPQWSLPGNVAELVDAVIKFGIEDLKIFLDDLLGEICTPENAGKLLGLTEKASMKKAVADILAFIRSEMICKDPQKYFNVVKKMKTD